MVNVPATCTLKPATSLWDPGGSLSLASGSHGYPTTAFDEDPDANLYSNLAYGAQALQYFTYWTPGINSSWDFHHAPIGLDGKRTDVYDRIKLVNSEIQHLAGVFLNARLVSVSHTGKQIPSGTRRVDKLPDPVQVLETGDGGQSYRCLKKRIASFWLSLTAIFKIL